MRAFNSFDPDSPKFRLVRALTGDIGASADLAFGRRAGGPFSGAGESGVDSDVLRERVTGNAELPESDFSPVQDDSLLAPDDYEANPGGYGAVLAPGDDAGGEETEIANRLYPGFTPASRRGRSRGEEECSTDRKALRAARARIRKTGNYTSRACFPSLRAAQGFLARLVRAGRLHHDGRYEYGGNFHRGRDGWGFTVRKGRTAGQIVAARMRAAPPGTEVDRLWHTHPKKSGCGSVISQAIARDGGRTIYSQSVGDVATVRATGLPLELWTPSGGRKIVMPGSVRYTKKLYDHNTEFGCKGGKFVYDNSPTGGYRRGLYRKDNPRGW